MTCPRMVVCLLAFIAVRPFYAQDGVNAKRRERELQAIPALRQVPPPVDPEWGPARPDPLVLARFRSRVDTNPIQSAFARHANVLATRATSRISLWDLNTGKEIRSFPTLYALHYPDLRIPFNVRTMAFAPDGKTLAVGGVAGELDLVDPETGGVMKQLELTGIPVHVAFSSDGKVLSAVALTQGSPVHRYALFVWSTDKWERKELTLNAKDSAIWAVSPSGRYFAHALKKERAEQKLSTDIDVWDLAKGEKRTYAPGVHNHHLAFRPDDSALLVMARNLKNYEASDMWTVALPGGEAEKVFELSYRPYQPQFTPDGKYLAVAGGLVEWPSGTLRWRGYMAPDRVSFSPGGTFVAEGGSLRVLGDMLHPDWADMAKIMIPFRGEQHRAEFYAGQIYGEAFPHQDGALTSLARALPQVMHMSIAFPKSYTAKGLSCLKELPRLETFTVKQAADLTDAQLDGLAGIKTLKTLRLEYSYKLKGPGLAAFADCPLETLILDGCPSLEDEGLKHIAKFKNLRQLVIRGGPKLTDAGLAELGELTNLRELSLYVREIRGDVRAVEPVATAAFFTHFKKLTNLEKLRIGGIKLKGAEAAPLADMTKLVEVHAALDDQALVFLKDHKGLKLLDLDNNQDFTGKGLTFLENLTQLEVLRLGGTSLTGQNAVFLKPFMNLREINISGTKTNDSVFAHLRDMTKLHTLHCGNDFIAKPGERMTGSGLAALKNCKDIKTLYLGDGFTDSAFAGLRDWTQLERLKAPRWTTDNGLAMVRNLPNLQEIDLSWCSNFKGRSLDSLKDLPSLRKINLRHSGITSYEMGALKDLKQVHWIDLSNTKVSGSLSAFEGLTNLRVLILPNGYGDRAIQELKQKLPKLSAGASAF